MDLLDRIKRHENLHIVFWLVKDSCWMLEIKWLGALMIVPTLSIALWIIYITRNMTEVYLNIAVFFWIAANSFWMVIEFFYHDQGKYLASIPFALGFIFVAVFYFKAISKKRLEQTAL
jgi:hypothetical protein